MRIRLGGVIVSMGCFASIAAAQPVISETFNTQLNGWTTYNDTSTPYWENMGNPGGCATGRDQGTGIYWGFSAPALFLGDKSCYYGGSFSWQINVSDINSVAAGEADIKIQSGTARIVYDLPHPSAANQWLTRSVPLSEVGWHMSTTTGAQPTAAQFQQILANITSIQLRMEFSTAIDIDRLDNVFMVPGSPCIACDPDTNQDGVADQGDVDYLINVIAGGPNPTNIDSDFNRDGVSDQGDIDALINVIAGAQCP